MTEPNVVFILCDQLRADFLGSYGADFAPTPHMDRIAEEGIRYENAISAYPVCVPARTALLTGMDAIKTGVTDNLRGLRPDYRDLGMRTWPELLAERGYLTAAIGKMHFYPWDASWGFGYRVIAEDKRWLNVHDDHDHALRKAGYRKRHGDEFEGYHEHKGAVVNDTPRELTPDGFVGDAAVEFIETYAGDGPFALMVGFPGPHCQYDPHPDTLERVDAGKVPHAVPAVPENTGVLRQKNIEGNLRAWNRVDYTDFPEESKDRIRAHYAALVAQIDDEIGRIVAALERAGVAENTVIILSSDHGDLLGDHDMIGKGMYFEGAIRVPILVKIPGGPRHRVEPQLVELHDITATILEQAGCAVPSYMDSVPLPATTTADGGREVIFGMLTGGWMAYDGRWKLHKYATGEILLFDLENDPFEQRNLVRDPAHLEVFLRLDQALTVEVLDSLKVLTDDRAVPVGWSVDAFGRRGWERPYPNPLTA
ncbi:MAG: Choline-sulfatase [Microbacterium sp.]|uniref:sulfatase family protein n=1 Tax=Microbacterium sp. TaxID=51671 RepID=UPI0026290EFE|nr:sulfatase-like hydrolase/transferase [Microbacterium sp.]MDF2562435.1 Choline-sulfatase [Microbacterium sp.]